MTGFFAIIFLAALIGVIKPYTSRLNRKHFGAIAFIAFILVAVTAPKSDEKTKQEVTASNGTTSPAPVDGVQNAVAAPAASTSKWQYSEDKDEMRGTTTRYAQVVSENTVDLDFPYGTVNGQIVIRKRPKDGLNIMFTVDKGQILCHSFGDDHISVKFDDGPVKRYSCTGTSDGSSETSFIENASGFLSNLKKAKRTIIEAEFYQKGNQQFTFDTAGLNWN